MEILAMLASVVGREMVCGDKISVTMALHIISFLCTARMAMSTSLRC